MDSGEYVISRLRQVLRRHQEKSSWRQISKEIRRASGASDVTIDRRTLAQICSDDWRKVSLSLGQLVALDTYFAYSNEGPFDLEVRAFLEVHQNGLLLMTDQIVYIAGDNFGRFSKNPGVFTVAQVREGLANRSLTDYRNHLFRQGQGVPEKMELPT